MGLCGIESGQWGEVPWIQLWYYSATGSVGWHPDTKAKQEKGSLSSLQLVHCFFSFSIYLPANSVCVQHPIPRYEPPQRRWKRNHKGSGTPPGSPNSATTGTTTTSAAATPTTGTHPPAATVTVIGPPPIGTTGHLELDCPSLNNTKKLIGLSSGSSTFTIICGGDYLDPELDILSTVAYSLEDCLMACVTYNLNRTHHTTGQRCAEVVFNLRISMKVKDNFGTCFLKYDASSFAVGNDMGVASGSL